MQSIKSYSMNLNKLLLGFRCFLTSKDLRNPEEFFQKEKFSREGWISQKQFQAIIKLSLPVSKFDALQVVSMFKQLDQGWEQIKISKFVQVYKLITNKIPAKTPSNQLPQLQRKKLQQQKQRKNKIIRSALHKLQKFMIQDEAMTLFVVYDEDQTGRLTKQQFNRLLIGTQIKEFQSKTIRRIVINQIFLRFPLGQMSKTQFSHFFRIPKEKVQKKQKFEFYVPKQKANYIKTIPQIPNKPAVKYIPNKPPIKLEPINNQNKTLVDKKTVNPEQYQINLKPPLNQNRTQEHNNGGFKKGKVMFQELTIRDRQIPQDKNQLVNCNQFTRASCHYRQGEPPAEEFRFLEQLQNMLTSKKQFRDTQNPITNKGKYCKATNFFGSQNYRLFQMAQSVLQRQKSRIGVARDIQPKDIIQGQLGDCYFLSGVASLISIYPEIVSQLFLFNQNPADYFVVKLFIDGNWQYISTDDYFPSQDGKSALFARPHGKQIWVMLLQKCWAKCFLSYSAIVSGSPKEAFIALTGAPAQYFSRKSNEITNTTIQYKIKKAYKSRHVVTASGSQQLQSMSQSQLQKIGLIKSHAYSFLKFIDVDGVNLVKVRNPWGTRIWKGDWSFQSNKWTQSLRDRLNYNMNPDDGSFYMDIRDFLQYFGSFVIGKMNPTYSNSSLKVKFKNHKSNYVRMRVQQSGKYILSLYQVSQRKMTVKYSNYTYSPARIIVLKTGNSWEYISSFQSTQSHSIQVQVNLQEGCEYVISGKFKWKFVDSQEACLTSYGPSKVAFEHIGNQIAPDFKKGMIQSFFQQNRGKVKTTDYEKIGAIGSYSQTFFDIEKGIGYYFITNPSQKRFQLSYSMKKQGLKVIKPDQLPFKFVLQKGSRYLKGFFVDPKGFNYQSSQSMKYFN